MLFRSGVGVGVAVGPSGSVAPGVGVGVAVGPSGSVAPGVGVGVAVGPSGSVAPGVGVGVAVGSTSTAVGPGITALAVPNPKSIPDHGITNPFDQYSLYPRLGHILPSSQ